MISCRKLTRRFGGRTAVDGLTLDVARGSICVCLGANGAGKSTTMRMLTGLLTPSAGEATVAGLNVTADSVALRRCIGVLPEDLGLFADLSVDEHLRLTADVFGLTRAQRELRMDQLVAALRLETVRRTFAGQCSHGTRKKVSLAMALLPNPRVLFLDEPFEAIDPVASRTIADVLTAAVSRGTTVFLTSHVLPVAQTIGTHFCILREGRLVFNATASELPGSLERVYFELAEGYQQADLDWLGSP